MSDKHRKSASLGQAVPLGRKLDEGLRQFLKLVRERNSLYPGNFERYQRDLDEYRQLARDHSGFDLETARLFEIGSPTARQP